MPHRHAPRIIGGQPSMWLHRYAKLVAASTIVLIVAGGLVTSTGSGLAVPDWPTTYGWSMFTFPLDKMVGGIFYEHGHRLIATSVGMLTIVLAAWLWWREPRRWVRVLGLIALAAVIAQGILGGLTVLFFLPPQVSIAHAGLAQIFFALTVSIALFTSPGWRQGYARARQPAPGSGHDAHDASAIGPLGAREAASGRDVALERIAVATTAVIYIQILIGALVRHTGAGLAIPDFPLAFGRVLPPVSLLHGPAAVHFAHRVGAMVVLALVIATIGRVWSRARRRRELIRPALVLAALVSGQIVLGGVTVLSGRHVAINTAHVVTGALLFATSLVLALRAHHSRLERPAVGLRQAA